MLQLRGNWTYPILVQETGQPGHASPGRFQKQSGPRWIPRRTRRFRRRSWWSIHAIRELECTSDRCEHNPNGCATTHGSIDPAASRATGEHRIGATARTRTTGRHTAIGGNRSATTAKRHSQGSRGDRACFVRAGKGANPTASHASAERAGGRAFPDRPDG